MKKFRDLRASFWLRIIILLGGLLANAIILNNYRNVGSDLVQDYIAANSLRRGGSLYGEDIAKLEKELVGFGGIENFHPPFNALLYLPLSFLSYNNAFLALGAISVILLLLINKFIVKGLELSGEWFLNFACFTLCWYPVFNCIGAGQSSMIIAACLIGGWYSLHYKKDYVAGFLFAIATLIKLFPGLTLLYLLIMRNWRALFSTVFFIAFGISLTALVVGLDDMHTYAIITVARDIEDFRGYVVNHSIGGIVTRLFGKPMGWFEPLVELPDISSLMILILSIGILIYTILKMREMAMKKGLSNYAFGLTLTAMLLLSPITWTHIFPVLILPIALLLREYIDEPTSKMLRIFLFVLILVSLPDVPIANMLVSTYHPFKMPLYGWALTLAPGAGIVILWIVLTRRAKRAKIDEC